MIRVIFLCVRKGVTSSFLDNDAKDSFNVTTNTVLFFIIADLMQSLSGRFLILVIEGMSNGISYFPANW